MRKMAPGISALKSLVETTVKRARRSRGYFLSLKHSIVVVCGFLVKPRLKLCFFLLFSMTQGQLLALKAIANFSRDQSRLLERFKEHAVHSCKEYFYPFTHAYSTANTLHRPTLPSISFSPSRQ